MMRWFKTMRRPACDVADPGSRKSASTCGRSESHSLFPASGFTLFEILIAVFIFAIIVSTIFGSFNAVFSGTQAMDQDLDVFDMGKTCLNRMVMDLQSVQVTLLPEYKPPEFNAPPDPFRIVLDTLDTGAIGFPSLRFASSEHTAMGGGMPGGIAEIVYYVQSNDDNQNVLRRSDRLYPYPPFEEKSSDPILCERVKKLEFKVFDLAGSEYDRWDSDSDDQKHATPRAVAVRLEIGDDNAAFVFETMVALPVFREEVKKTF